MSVSASEPPVISITDSSEDEAKDQTETIKTVELDSESQDGGVVETIVVQEADTSISTTVLNLTNSFQQTSAPQLLVVLFSNDCHWLINYVLYRLKVYKRQGGAAAYEDGGRKPNAVVCDSSISVSSQSHDS